MFFFGVFGATDSDSATPNRFRFGVLELEPSHINILWIHPGFWGKHVVNIKTKTLPFCLQNSKTPTSSRRSTEPLELSRTGGLLWVGNMLNFGKGNGQTQWDIWWLARGTLNALRLFLKRSQLQRRCRNTLSIMTNKLDALVSQIPWESCEVSGPPKGLLRGPNTYSEGIWLKIGSSCSKSEGTDAEKFARTNKNTCEVWEARKRGLSRQRRWVDSPWRERAGGRPTWDPCH